MFSEYNPQLRDFTDTIKRDLSGRTKTEEEKRGPLAVLACVGGKKIVVGILAENMV